MKIHVLSDLHLEFAPFRPPSLDADVVVLAGDIDVGMNVVSWIEQQFGRCPVVYVLGNHEYYRHAVPTHQLKVSELARGSHVRVLENESVVLDGVAFLGCTLWTDFRLFGDPEIAAYEASRRMTDYKRIRVAPSYRRLRPSDTAGMHHRSRVWLERQFEQLHGAPTVVVTHHAPSRRSLPPGADDDLGAAFASPLDELVERSGARLWIHGHLHTASDYRIGSTRVLCNPRGYPAEVDTGFAPDLIAEI